MDQSQKNFAEWKKPDKKNTRDKERPLLVLNAMTSNENMTPYLHIKQYNYRQKTKRTEDAM